jgi:hypothetical protein
VPVSTDPATTGTLLVDPQFESATYFRPLPSSPAIDAGLADAAVAGFDVEGNRQPATGAPDLGAYERAKDFGARESFAGGAISEPLAISNPFLLNNGHPIATPLGGSGFSFAQLEQAHALWFNGSNWQLRMGTLPLAAGRQFNVMAPRDNHVHFLHTASLLVSASELNDPSTNNQANAVVIVNERFDRVGSNQMDGNPLSVYYGTGANRWYVSNENSAPMTAGSRFDVIVSTLESGMSFSTNMRQSELRLVLRHPVLDDNPCAVFSVGRRGLIFNPQPFVVNYVPASTDGQRPGRWQIQQPTGFGFPQGAQFNVIIDGTASSRCPVAPPLPNDIFRNGFE